jgi:hypothetical protein
MRAISLIGIWTTRGRRLGLGPDPNGSGPDLLPASRAAAALELSAKIVSNWIARGLLPSTPGAGTTHLVDPRELEVLARERLSGVRATPTLDRAMNSLATAVTEHVTAMADRRLREAEERAQAAYREAIGLAQEIARRLTTCDAER